MNNLNGKSYGYGYGVWLVVKDKMGMFDLKHIPHITIMCYMEKEEAKKLYIDIVQSMGNKFEVKLNNICKLIPSYKDDEQLYACGFDCFASDWPLFQKICEKYSGSFSNNPHLSYNYSQNIEELQYKSFDKDNILECELHIADITDANSINWNIITNSS
jgi:hypothetical protein